jgi:hypothetical protein
MKLLSERAGRRGLVALFALNAVAAMAAATVLALWPAAIPAAAGISIDRSQNLLPYLLAAAELAIAALAALAIRARSAEAERITVGVLIIFHLGSAAAGIAVVLQGAGVVVVFNIVVRVLLVIALGVCSVGRLKTAPR